MLPIPVWCFDMSPALWIPAIFPAEMGVDCTMKFNPARVYDGVTPLSLRLTRAVRCADLLDLLLPHERSIVHQGPEAADPECDR